MNKEYCVIRYRNDDGLHDKGDLQYIVQNVLYIGQTPECSLKLPAHPDYADTCYAVIIRNNDNSGWRIVRQDKDADISINGTPLRLAAVLDDNDRISFDNTILLFNIEVGETPEHQYVKYKTASWVHFSFAAVFLLITGIMTVMYMNSRKTMTVFEDEIGSICKIEAEEMLVLSDKGDTLEVLSVPRAFVGTGFITDNGYFVTARHCIEFWLSMENELKPDFDDIGSEIVRKAIEVEMDESIRLVTSVKITSHDGNRSWSCSSDDFMIDRTRDNLYEYGDFESGYIWRSVVSLFEKRDAESGDVAVMKWEHGPGTISLGEPDAVHETGTELCCFGYPQNEEQQEAAFALDEGNVYQKRENPDECFICTKGLDQGFSGGPVFTKDNKTVAGIVSRSSDNHTLVVPVSHIHRLISKTR